MKTWSTTISKEKIRTCASNLISAASGLRKQNRGLLLNGLAKELMQEYVRQRRQEGRRRLILTCLDSKVSMYQKFGFTDDGISKSTWGGQKWHQMTYRLQDKERDGELSIR